MPGLPDNHQVMKRTGPGLGECRGGRVRAINLSGRKGVQN